METVTQIQRLRSRRLPFLVIGVTLTILGGTILLARQQLRGKIREQIIGRDGEGLHAVALMLFQQHEEEAEADIVGPIEDPANQLTVLLKASRLKGVLALRLFDAQGRFVEAFPLHVREANLHSADLPVLKKLRPASHFHEAIRLSEILFPLEGKGPETEPPVPLLEVNVPLHTRANSPLVGIAQFILEGQSIAAEFARLDRHLTLQALAAFVVGGGLLAVVIALAFRRLQQVHRLLEARTTNLLQANQELALAAKTSAVGAVTSHLIHGLKNPLSGLQSFVSNLSRVNLKVIVRMRIGSKPLTPRAACSPSSTRW